MTRAAEKKAPKEPKAPAMNNRQYTATSIRAADDDDTGRVFELSFSSQEPYERWWGVEILDHSEGACDLTRLQEIGVVLFNHDRDYVLGKILDVWISDKRGYAKVEFDTDEDAEKIFQKVKSGTLKGVSVSYSIDSLEEVAANKTSADGQFQGPCYIARKWTALEISIVSVPADPTVGVGREQELPPFVKTNTNEVKEASTMSTAEAAMRITTNFLLS